MSRPRSPATLATMARPDAVPTVHLPKYRACPHRAPIETDITGCWITAVRMLADSIIPGKNQDARHVERVTGIGLNRSARSRGKGGVLSPFLTKPRTGQGGALPSMNTVNIARGEAVRRALLAVARACHERDVLIPHQRRLAAALGVNPLQIWHHMRRLIIGGAIIVTRERHQRIRVKEVRQ